MPDIPIATKPSTLGKSLATTGTAGAVATLVLFVLSRYGIQFDESTEGAVVTLTISACHLAVEVWQYVVQWLPKAPSFEPAQEGPQS